MWPPVLPPGTLVYCPDCDEKVTVNVVPNDAVSVDLLCPSFHIIATLFRPE